MVFVYSNVRFRSNDPVTLFVSNFLQNFFLRQDRLNGDVPPHLAQPCCVALGQALDSGLVSRLV